MKFSVTALLSLAIVVSNTNALFTPRDEESVCKGAKAVSTSLIPVGSKMVEMTTFSCDMPESFRVLDAAPSNATAGPDDVCGELCINVCTNSGTLPPTTDDCAVIMDAVTIFNGSHAPDFTVSNGHAQVLSFGTCRMFFENFSPNPLAYCWLSLGQVASAAGSACLPPVQPVNSEGFCIANTGLWRVGIAHA
ncbi:hypothetical protein C8Q80DRAFT_1274562 [Daedaleopsis nitida]|nr:hypothetical protein C8Q80DRAFT_1274562 [Daedaleopsis nitida]